jgi:hypothetical protein
MLELETQVCPGVASAEPDAARPPAEVTTGIDAPLRGEQ